jgi:uncharacterized membrane protein YbaN (DUF454 family)
MGPPPEVNARRNGPLPAAVRWALFALALLSLALGLIGLFLPLIPTVPFVLLAAWAAARSSPRLAHWLEHHPRIGPLILDWRNGGVVRRSAKWTASVLMAMSAASLLVLLQPRWAAWGAVTCLGVVLAWLWRRPERLPG